MSDLKTDLINELLLQKNYLERELVRLSNQPITITYRDVVNGMLYDLEQLALVDTKLNYIDKYFVEKHDEGANAPDPNAPTPQTNTQEGNPVPKAKERSINPEQPK